ncbi:uncharacterized protein [Aristolochia californica]|uniref:uncharacterized protein n=1 Tax=Aristolochia californica TaxID=171875 RepID=UPI0035D8D279
MIRSNVLTASRTEQILSRYRPIAPKPQFFPSNLPFERTPPPANPPAAAPFVADFSNLLQKPSKTRKRSRGRASFSEQKRAKSIHVGDLAYAANTQLGLSLPGFNRDGFRSEKPTSSCGELVTLPLLPCSNETETLLKLYSQVEEVGDLKGNAEAAEKNLLCELNAPPLGGANTMGCGNVITPQPVRPVGSSISIGCVTEATQSNLPPVPKKPEEVEEEVETGVLPSVVSDSHNRVRLANSAYKEMVGQPECPWLHSVAASRRLSGGVMLDLSDASVPVSSNSFSCRVRIEWASNGRKIFINAPCDVIRLSCKSKDYQYTWRFHTNEAF